MKEGLNLWDTAYVYGMGTSEKILGDFLRGVPRESYLISDKFTPQCADPAAENAVTALYEKSAELLGTDYMDFYWIHNPMDAPKWVTELIPLAKSGKIGKIRAIGVCSFYPDRLLDLCYNVEITPQINQIERHPHYQRKEDLEIMKELGVQAQAWAPFAEGMKGMFDEPVLKEIAEKHGKTPAQIILRWNVQQGVIVIPKSVHRERMRENLDIWDFELDDADMEQIAGLDKDCPSMLDTRKISEVRRVYNYLNNPVLTSL